MGFFKKIFKPVSKVLDKVVPNEIKPALPFLAAFAPMIAPGIMGAFGNTMLSRAAMGGGLNLLGQLSQEGNEGDVNLLSAGLGALTGAMTAPADSVTGQTSADFFRSKMTPTGNFKDVITDTVIQRPELTGLQKAANYGLEGLAKGSDIFAAGMADPFSKAGLTAAALPAATATGDLMYAQAKRDQDAYDDAMAADAEADADSDARRAFAIRRAMEAQGATEEEIEDAIYAAGYKKGGRVKFKFGGIDAAIDQIENENVKESMKFVSDTGNMDIPIMDLVEEFEITFKRKPKNMDELKQFYRDRYEYKGPGDVKMQENIKEKVVMEAKDGGLMNLGGKEMDLRGGGFVPIGKKEKADDVPARLSKNEFVMTADAVRAAGGGSVNEGAKRMYKVMNDLEARA